MNIAATIAERHRRGRIAWFFDLDGTLIHAEPGKNAGVAADIDLQKLLNALNCQAAGSVAVITGRPRIFVEETLPGRRFGAGVEHGALLQEKLYDPWINRSPLDAQKITSIRAVLQDRIKGVAGAQVEDHKHGTLTIEFTRAADPERLGDTLATAINEWIATQPGLALDVIKAVVPGNCVIEVLPQNLGKASAVDHFMALRDFSGKLPVFCGDSEGDRKAMEHVKALGGFAIGIGPKAPACADIRFDTVAQMRAFLLHAINPAHPAPRP